MTPKQYSLLTFIRNSIVHVGKAPTFSEMKDHMGVTSNQTIGDWISILEREGYIARNKGKLRGITVLEKGLKGFDENLQVQKDEAIKRSFSPVGGTTGVNVYNISQTNFDKGININAKGIIPAWEGGEKNGSS